MSKPVVRAELPIRDWIQGLAGIPAAEFTQDNVQHYILQHAIQLSSLEPFTFFSSHRYTRNLIFRNDLFECLALCWEIGQSSSIHDHSDKLGWIYLASGRLFVQNYHVQERDPAHQTCRLVRAEGAELDADQDSYVDKEQAVHKVCNLPRFHQRAISIHVYEQPMSHCEVYSLQTGAYEVVQLSYTSELGRLNPGVEL